VLSALRISSAAALAIAALLLASAVPAGAATKCNPKGSRTLANNSVMRVYKGRSSGDTTKVYGCLLKTGKAVLIDSTNDPFGFSLKPLVLTRGLAVGFSDNEGGGDSASSTVKVYNLKTGKRALSAPTKTDGSEVSGMVVNGKGSLAWIENDPDTPLHHPTLVRAFDSQGLRVLDTSLEIDTRSLTISKTGTLVSWTNAGTTKSASLNP
jgi:hypothetical protein